MFRMKKPSDCTNKIFLSLLFACAVLAPSLAFAPPPPPDPAVPAGSEFAFYTVGLGVAGYGAWAIWKAKRNAKKNE